MVNTYVQHKIVIGCCLNQLLNNNKIIKINISIIICSYILYFIYFYAFIYAMLKRPRKDIFDSDNSNNEYYLE